MLRRQCPVVSVPALAQRRVSSLTPAATVCDVQELRDTVVQRLAAIEAAVAGTAAAQAERFEGTKQLLKVGGQAGMDSGCNLNH